MNDLSFKIPPNIKFLMVPSLVIVAVFLVLVLFAPESISRVNAKIKEYNKVQKEEILLETKLDSLKSISTSSLDPNDTTVIALPSKDSSMWIVSQVRMLSKENETNVTKLSSSGGKEDKGLRASEISLEFEVSDYSLFLNFTKSLAKILPLTSLNGISLSRRPSEENLFTGSLAGDFYWSDFPEVLPKINEPLKELTEGEKELLKNISGYRRPLFLELDPGNPQNRPQPFN